MVKRRVPLPQPSNIQESDDELELPVSQGSTGNDENDQEIKKIIEKYYTDNLEKKKAQREKKILEYAEGQLNNELKASAKVVEDAMEEIESLYEAFLMDHAACEDRIRQKWSELHETEAELRQFGEERQKEDEERFKAASASHGKGLSKMKFSCNLFQETIECFFPGDTVEDSS